MAQAVRSSSPSRRGWLPSTNRPLEALSATVSAILMRQLSMRESTISKHGATQAVAAAVALGADPVAAVAAVSRVDEVAGRYRTLQVGEHTVRMLLAKNPAGWAEALPLAASDPVILAIVLIFSIVVMLSNLLVDIAYPLLDPRAASKKKGEE